MNDAARSMSPQCSACHSSLSQTTSRLLGCVAVRVKRKRALGTKGCHSPASAVNSPSVVWICLEELGNCPQDGPSAYRSSTQLTGPEMHTLPDLAAVLRECVRFNDAHLHLSPKSSGSRPRKRGMWISHSDGEHRLCQVGLDCDDLGIISTSCVRIFLYV